MIDLEPLCAHCLAVLGAASAEEIAAGGGAIWVTFASELLILCYMSIKLLMSLKTASWDDAGVPSSVKTAESRQSSSRLPNFHTESALYVYCRLIPPSGGTSKPARRAPPQRQASIATQQQPPSTLSELVPQQRAPTRTATSLARKATQAIDDDDDKDIALPAPVLTAVSQIRRRHQRMT